MFQGIYDDSPLNNDDDDQPQYFSSKMLLNDSFRLLNREYVRQRSNKTKTVEEVFLKALRMYSVDIYLARTSLQFQHIELRHNHMINIKYFFH